MTKDERLNLEHKAELAWKIRRRSRVESLELAKWINAESIGPESIKSHLYSTITLAVHDFYEANYESGLIKLAYAEKRLQQFDEPLWFARLLNTYSFAYINMGKLNIALEYLSSGLTYSKTNHLDEMTVFFLANLAEVHTDPLINKHAEAVDYLLEAERLCIKTHHDLLSIIQAYIARSKSILGDWQDALAYAHLALASTEDCLDKNSIDLTHNMVGEFYFEYGEYDLAIDLANKSIEKELHYSESYGLAENHQLLARTYYAQGNNALALEHGLIAMEGVNKKGMDLMKGRLAKLLSKIYENIGDYSNALEYHKIVLEEKNKTYTKELKDQIGILTIDLKNLLLPEAIAAKGDNKLTQKETLSTAEHLKTELIKREEYLILQEKMSTLSSLVAGFTHEIFSPFEVTEENAQNMLTYADKVIVSDFPTLLTQIDSETLEHYLKILHCASKPQRLISADEENNARNEMIKQIEKNQIPSPTIIVNRLIHMQLLDINEDVRSVILNPFRENLLNTCFELSDIIRNLENIKMSIPPSILNYSADPTNKENQGFYWTDPVDRISTVLQFFQNQLSDSIQLVWDISSNEKIQCKADELDQVWMNLIQNALQAMGSTGTLTIHIHSLGEYLLVSIEDSGIGIPSENITKIFEPFFSSQKQGLRSGLGLHLVKSIISKNKGSISVSSVPGKTLFKVTLPIKQ